ncbi:MAG: MFS transporter [Proteobacteria bacterium]|nr:MFS transporter [Pseudomonadota bacterium]
MSIPVDARPAYPSPVTAWTMVALLTLAYIVSYLDRSILGALVQPIKADLAISDESMGYLSGIAFGIFYGVIGLPLGWLADRRRRTRIVASGVTLWSFATVASGLARGFGQLFVARMAVGVGEAVLSPCAMSLIGDSFPPEKRGKPVGVYSTALALGVGVSGLIGALVLSVGKDGVTLPLLGALKAWQFAFVVVGLPGLVLAPLFLLLREPVRRSDAATPSGFTEAFTLLGRNFWALGGVMLLTAVMTTIAYSQFFNVAAFARTYGWDAKDYLKINGLLNLIIGPFVVIAAGVVIDRLRARGIGDAAFRVLAFAFVPMVPLCALGLFMPNAAAAFVVMASGSVCLGIITSAAILALLEVTPAHLRGQIVAIYYMTISILGQGLGPTTTGILSTRLYGEDNLRWAIATVPVLYGVVPIVLLPMIGRAYRKRFAEVAA